jgi:hypothetical protein
LGAEEQQCILTDRNTLVSVMKDVIALEEHDLIEIAANVGWGNGV